MVSKGARRQRGRFGEKSLRAALFVGGPAALALLGLSAPLDAAAGYGAYPHGYGIKSLGLGGIGYVMAEDTYTLSVNPANAAVLGERYDYGIDLETVFPVIAVHGNALAADASYSSRANYFPIPQIGAAFPLTEDLSFGVTAFFAGFGSDYRDSPFARFGGASRVTLNFAQIGATTALAWTPRPGQSLGIALNFSDQLLDVRGADAFQGQSEDPGHFTNQGKDSALGIGFTVGWLGHLTDHLVGAASYRSRTFTQRASGYAGLLPDGGRLELPTMFGGGLSWTPVPDWTMAFEFQRSMYTSQKATGNTLGQVSRGHPFGSPNGPGFGWNDQNIYKLGVAWQALPALKLRVGTSYGTQVIPNSQILFGSLAPSVAQYHYTCGTTWDFARGWEFSAYYGISNAGQLHGENSIPTLAGGGEADLRITREQFGGVSFGHTIGR